MTTIESLDIETFRQRKSLTSNKTSNGNLLNCSTSTIDFEDSESAYVDERDLNHSLFSSELFIQARKSSSVSLNGKVMNTKKISGASVIFVEKSLWMKEFNCYICNIGVDKKGVGRHHCRLCGGSVCGGCSDRAVNGQRTCDMCFYKLKTEADIRRREELLLSKNETIEKMKIRFLQKTEKLKLEKAKTIEQKIFCQQADQQERQMQQQLFAERIEVEEGFTRVRELHDCLSSSVNKNNQIISDKENKLQTLRNNLLHLKNQISEQIQIEEAKKSELQTLCSKYKSLSEEKLIIQSQKINSRIKN